MRYVFLLTVLFFFTAHPTFAKEKEGVKKESQPVAATLERVIDGDTFVSFGKSIRLWGIDAPEKGDVHFLASKLYLEAILEEAPFSCRFKHKDRYQRLVMQCFSEGEDVARMMVRMGMAKDYLRYSNGEYAEDERLAKEMRYGVWSK